MYGLIGKKLSHSFSADFFNDKFSREGINESYHLFPLESIDSLPSLINRYSDLKGLNVTIPYKKEVIKYLDQLSEEAEEIGAVNVIKIERNQDKITLKGYNTDAIGFEKSLVPVMRPEIKQALVLGTGGASKAVEFVMKKLGIEYKFVSRNPLPGQLIYLDLNSDTLKDNMLIVNTTPLGMFPNIKECPNLPYEMINNSHVCFDLVYNPEETEFLKKVKEKGATVKNGLEMLHLQALAAWDIWKDSK